MNEVSSDDKNYEGGPNYYTCFVGDWDLDNSDLIYLTANDPKHAAERASELHAQANELEVDAIYCHFVFKGWQQPEIINE